MIHLWWWFQHVTGMDAPGSRAYNFWSGFGSDIAEFAILGGVIQAYRHINCSVKRCPRIGRHTVEGTSYKTCHKHSTGVQHKHLFSQHKRRFPLQHKLFNK